MSCAFGSAGGTETTTTDSLYEAALSSVGQASIEESIKAFEQVIRADRQYAPAYAELARLLMMRNRTQDRMKARKMIQTAINLEPDQLEYPLMLGDILWVQGFWFNAEQQYEKVFKAHPNNAKAAYGIGYYALKNYLKYKDMMGEDFGFTGFAQKDIERAVVYLKRAIEADPSFKDAYYQLGLGYIENHQPVKLIELSNQLRTQYPDEKNALLFSALGHHTNGNYRDAHAFYFQALNRMELEERSVMESIELVANKLDREHIVLADTPPDNNAAEGWTDSPELAAFWRKQDPLFLTEFNERRMEHYRRIAYANLRFSRPSEGIAGWQTDMGKTYIKFGHYIYRRSGRPYIRDLDALSDHSRTAASKAMDRTAQTHLFAHIETWFYEGYKIEFMNWDGLDRWRFATEKVFKPVVPEITQAGGASRPDLPSSDPTGLYRFTSQSPRYIDPYKQFKYQPPHLIAAFRDGEHTRVELAYALPTERLDIRAEGVDLVDGLFLFDMHWEEVHRAVQTLEKLMPLGTDSLRNSYFLAQHTVQVKPGTYNLVAELLDRRTNAIGAVRALHTCAMPDTGLAMSDLLLASRIDTRKNFPESRRDLQIIPNPLRTYTRSDPVFLYLEVYNLTRDSFGRTRFDIAYRISLPDRRDIDPGLFMALDAHSDTVQVVSLFDPDAAPLDMPQLQVQYRLPKHNQLREELKHLRGLQDRVETSVSAEYEGDRADDFTFLEIDIHQLPAGIYALTVTVSDRHTGQSVDQSLLFRVVE